MLWLVGAALAAQPAGLLAEEADQWDPYWSRLQDGPNGCWEVVARATWDWEFGKFGISKGNAAFIGKLEDGVWKDMFIRSLGESFEKPGENPIRVYPHDELRFAPLVGQLGQHILGEEQVEDDVLGELVNMFGGAVSTTWSGWDDARGGVVLHRSIPMGPAERAEGMMDVLFPEGGTLPTRLDFHVSEGFALPNDPGIKVREADARIRGHIVNDAAFVDAETFSFVASVYGYKVWGSQTIRYDAFRPCGGAVDAELKPLTP